MNWTTHLQPEGRQSLVAVHSPPLMSDGAFLQPPPNSSSASLPLLRTVSRPPFVPPPRTLCVPRLSPILRKLPVQNRIPLASAIQPALYSRIISTYLITAHYIVFAFTQLVHSIHIHSLSMFLQRIFPLSSVHSLVFHLFVVVSIVAFLCLIPGSGFACCFTYSPFRFVHCYRSYIIHRISFLVPRQSSLSPLLASLAVMLILTYTHRPGFWVVTGSGYPSIPPFLFQGHRPYRYIHT